GRRSAGSRFLTPLDSPELVPAEPDHAERDGDRADRPAARDHHQGDGGRAEVARFSAVDRAARVAEADAASRARTHRRGGRTAASRTGDARGREAQAGEPRAVDSDQEYAHDRAAGEAEPATTGARAIPSRAPRPLTGA